MKGRKTKHYVNNKDFYEALVEYKKICTGCKNEGRPLPQIPRYIGECIQMICNKLSVKWNFGKYTFLEEMIEDGILNCVAAVDNFKPEASNNPFSYFTTIAWNAFIRRIEQESALNYTKHKNLENWMILSDEFYSEFAPAQPATKVTNHSQKIDNDGLQRHYDVIKAFESKIARKKEKSRQNSLQKKSNDHTSKPKTKFSRVSSNKGKF